MSHIDAALVAFDVTQFGFFFLGFGFESRGRGEAHLPFSRLSPPTLRCSLCHFARQRCNKVTFCGSSLVFAGENHIADCVISSPREVTPRHRHFFFFVIGCANIFKAEIRSSHDNLATAERDRELTISSYEYIFMDASERRSRARCVSKPARYVDVAEEDPSTTITKNAIEVRERGEHEVGTTAHPFPASLPHSNLAFHFL